MRTCSNLLRQGFARAALPRLQVGQPSSHPHGTCRRAAGHDRLPSIHARRLCSGSCRHRAQASPPDDGCSRCLWQVCQPKCGRYRLQDHTGHSAGERDGGLLDGWLTVDLSSCNLLRRLLLHKRHPPLPHFRLSGRLLHAEQDVQRADGAGTAGRAGACLHRQVGTVPRQLLLPWMRARRTVCRMQRPE